MSHPAACWQTYDQRTFTTTHFSAEPPSVTVINVDKRGCEEELEAQQKKHGRRQFFQSLNPSMMKFAVGGAFQQSARCSCQEHE